MTVQELIDNLKNVNPDAEVTFSDVDFNTYYIDDGEDFADGVEVTIYICE